MKRPIEDTGEEPITVGDKKMKKIKPQEQDKQVLSQLRESVLSDENLLYEVLKHVDARTLGAAACVSRQWRMTALDERLWELICTNHWANIGGADQQLRSVVLALGGFRRLHSLYLWPLSKSSLPPLAPPPEFPANSAAAASRTRWGKDESGKMKERLWIFGFMGMISRFLETTFQHLNQFNKKR